MFLRHGNTTVAPRPSCQAVLVPGRRVARVVALAAVHANTINAAVVVVVEAVAPHC